MMSARPPKMHRLRTLRSIAESRPSCRSIAARRCARRCGSCRVRALLGAAAPFVLTYAIDRAAYHGNVILPSWVNNARFGLARRARRPRAAPIDHRVSRAHARRPGAARVLHPSCRALDPAPEVIAGIARDLPSAIATEFSADNGRRASTAAAGDLLSRLETEGATLAATSSGYLQFVRYSTLADIAVEADAVVELLYRPGHFVARGLP